MDCDLMHFDYCLEQEEFFNAETQKMSSKKNFVAPLNITKTVNINTPVPFI